MCNIKNRGYIIDFIAPLKRIIKINAYYGGKVNNMKNSNYITTNNMANVFGSKFDLSTEEVINIIKKMYKLKKIDFTFNLMEAEVALYNSDYYVRPGIAKTCFMSELMNLFAESKVHCGKADSDHLYFRFIILALNTMKKFFDESYFEEQIKRRIQVATSIVNKDKLRTYLKKLDSDKLELFLNTVVHYRLERGLFITDVSSAGFWAKIHESYRAAGVNVPQELDSPQGLTFLNDSKNYYFNVLSTKAIANMLCDAIDIDIELASSAAKKLYTSGYDAMINYIRLKIDA